MQHQVDRRGFLCAAGAAALAAFLPRALAQGAAARKPNIVYILADDLGWMDLACYGGKVVRTPHLDKLAADGMRFTNAYAACPVCSPTRASVMTGKYPARLHLTDYIPGRDPKNRKLLVPAWTKTLEPAEVTIAAALKQAGYATGIFGKWHLACEPRERGFDEDPVPSAGSPPAKSPDLSDKQAQAACAFIEKHKDRPFFCYLPFNAVHVPLSPRPEVVAKYADKVAAKAKPSADYLAVTEEMDRCIGLVLAKLDALKLGENTIVIFMSDNGGFSGATVNTPLRAVKGTVYEGGIRVPMIVRWPGVTKAGTTCDVPVTSVDHYPTMLAMAGAAGDAAHNKNVDGVSIVDLLKGGAAPQREAIYWHYPHYHAGPPSGAVRAGDWKLIEFYETGSAELYNLKDDIGEENDLATKNPQKAEELKAMLAQWRQSVGAQMPTVNPSPTTAPAGGKRGPVE